MGAERERERGEGVVSFHVLKICGFIIIGHFFYFTLCVFV